MSVRTYPPSAAAVRLRGSLTPAQVVDLIILAELMILVPGLLLLDAPWLRVPIGILATLIAPGYALTAALFPERKDLDGIARAALSVGLSVATLPLLALLLDWLPWGLAPLPMATALALLTCGFCVAAGVRRYLSAGPYTRFVTAEAPLALPRLSWGQRAAVAAAVLVAAWGMVVYTVVLTAPTRLTEFYALGAGGLAEAYPRAAAAGEPASVALGITNREGEGRRYRVEVRAGGAVVGGAGPIFLGDGDSWREAVRFVPPAAGADQAVEILLFEGAGREPYRRLRLWLDVEARP